LTPSFNFGRRKLIPSLEQVTASEPQLDGWLVRRIWSHRFGKWRYGYADQRSDLVSASSSFDEVLDLLDSFRRKL
jgi:hypothetical protein